MPASRCAQRAQFVLCTDRIQNDPKRKAALFFSRHEFRGLEDLELDNDDADEDEDDDDDVRRRKTPKKVRELYVYGIVCDW